LPLALAPADAPGEAVPPDGLDGVDPGLGWPDRSFPTPLALGVGLADVPPAAPPCAPPEWAPPPFEPPPFEPLPFEPLPLCPL
jgi:hypothetical protein